MTLRDWIELLLLTVVLAGGATVYTRVMGRRLHEAEGRHAQEGGERATEHRPSEWEMERRRSRARWQSQLERSCDAALQAYLDSMAELLKDGLLASRPGDALRHLAGEQTLGTLRQLDGKRRGALVRFLHGSGLIGQEAIVHLAKAELVGAFLRGADLEGANLSAANLRGGDLGAARLSGADLSWANLQGADLCRADLAGANLRGSFLPSADLSDATLRGVDLRWTNMERASLQGADLEGSDLRWTNLEGADLTGATVSAEQLEQAKSLEAATMPDGTLRD
jgi:hypothetical protein